MREHKPVPQVVLELGLLSEAQLEEIFAFENLVSEIPVAESQLEQVSW